MKAKESWFPKCPDGIPDWRLCPTCKILHEMFEDAEVHNE